MAINGESPGLSKPSWHAVVLVCKACSKRGSGPRGLKAKAVASAIKHALHEVKPRPRLVLTSCLGICPKGAMAVALVGGDAGARICAVQSLAQAAGVAALARTPPVTASSA